jgi:hypothetical protein
VTPHPAGSIVELGGVRTTDGDAVDVAVAPDGTGAAVVYPDGALALVGGTATDIDTSPLPAPAGLRVVSGIAVPGGYLLVTDRGQIIGRGAVRKFGDLSGVRLNASIVDAVATTTGAGYWLLGADGGVFAFGDATFHGSTGSLRLNRPANGMVADPDGSGYWFVADDGGVFAFDAPFRGSMGATPLNGRVVAMVAHGNGYLLAGADGGVFVFSDRAYLGSLGGVPEETRDDPVVSAAALPDTSAYLLLHRSGRLTSFAAGGVQPAWITEGDDVIVPAGRLFTATVWSRPRDYAQYSVYFNGEVARYAGLDTVTLEVPPGLTNLTSTLYVRTGQGATSSTRPGWGGFGLSTQVVSVAAGALLALDATVATTGRPMPTMVFSVSLGSPVRVVDTPLVGEQTEELEVHWRYLGQTLDPSHLGESPAPVLTRVEPSSGPEAGGNWVYVSGLFLGGATSVLFGSTPATMVTSPYDSEVTAMAPPGHGTVPITVTTPGGTSTQAFVTYTYVPPS